MREGFQTWKSPLAATLLLVLLIAAASFWATDRINREEEETSFPGWRKRLEPLPTILYRQ